MSSESPISHALWTDLGVVHPVALTVKVGHRLGKTELPEPLLLTPSPSLASFSGFLLGLVYSRMVSNSLSN